MVGSKRWVSVSVPGVERESNNKSRKYAVFDVAILSENTKCPSEHAWSRYMGKVLGQVSQMAVLVPFVVRADVQTCSL